MDGDQKIQITDTDDQAATFTKSMQRLFGEKKDPTDPTYCTATLFQTFVIPFLGRKAMPIKAIATYRLLRKDRNGQTYKFWQVSGINAAREKSLTGQKVDLDPQQVRWVYLTYWGPVALLLGWVIIYYLLHWTTGWTL